MSAPVLFVAADRGEAAGLPSGAELLVTGVGLVRAAAAVARRLARREYSRVVNIGTAGALHDGMRGVYEVGSVTQHDLDVAAIERIMGVPFPVELSLPLVGDGALPTARLASGDAFISDAAVRARLAASADLAEMEGYAVAWAAREAGVPVTLLKQVSDNADDESEARWLGALPRAAVELADAARTLGFV